ncbi:MAG: ISAs1 family transposase [Pseudomonadales bacterium]
MKNKTSGTKPLLEHLFVIPDPRMENKCDPALENIMAIAICAIIAGADDWNAIASFGEAKRAWFETFPDLKNGIPSHDTFRRFFSILSAKTFQGFFTGWVKDIAGLVEGVIAIDGKTVRRSHGLGKKAIQGQCLVCGKQPCIGAGQDGGKVQRDHRHTGTAQRTGHKGLHRND